MVPLNDYSCKGLTYVTHQPQMQVPLEILVSNPSSHDEPILAQSESSGDAQKERPDQDHYGKNTTPEEVNVVVRAGRPDLRQSAHEEVLPMQQDAGYFMRTHIFRETKDNFNFIF